MDEAISRYLVKLRRANPFLATLSIMASYHFDETEELFSTDAMKISVNPTYFDGLQAAEKTGLLLHLTLHAALLHPVRQGGRNTEVWNIAADIVVNNIITDAGQFIVPPKTAVEPKYRENSVEQVYEALKSLHKKHSSLKQAALSMPCSAENTNQESKNTAQPNAYQLQQVLNGLYPHHADLKHSKAKQQASEANAKAARTTNTNASSNASKQSQSSQDKSQAKRHAEKAVQHWRGVLRKAEVAARMSGQGRGEIPAGLLLEIDQMMNPELDWRFLLWQFVVRTPDDFEGFDRRFIHQGLYLDQLESSRLDVVVAVDTSGSIDTFELTQFMSEVIAISSAYDFIDVKLYYVDADIYGPYELHNGLEQAPPQGGGGTDFKVFFEKLLGDESLNSPDLIVYFTDGDGTFPKQTPDVETMWVVTEGGLSNDVFPFGSVVRLVSQN